MCQASQVQPLLMFSCWTLISLSTTFQILHKLKVAGQPKQRNQVAATNTSNGEGSLHRLFLWCCMHVVSSRDEILSWSDGNSNPFGVSPLEVSLPHAIMSSSQILAPPSSSIVSSSLSLGGPGTWEHQVCWYKVQLSFYLIKHEPKVNLSSTLTYCIMPKNSLFEKLLELCCTIPSPLYTRKSRPDSPGWQEDTNLLKIQEEPQGTARENVVQHWQYSDEHLIQLGSHKIVSELWLSTWSNLAQRC